MFFFLEKSLKEEANVSVREKVCMRVRLVAPSKKVFAFGLEREREREREK